MKILCVADHIDPLVHSTQNRERFSDIDLVISAGDLPMSYLGFLSGSLNRPVLFVFGNHNLKYLNRFRRGAKGSSLFSLEPSRQIMQQHQFGSTCADGRVIRVKRLLIAGLGGSMRYNRGRHQFTELQMLFRMLLLAPRLFWNRIAYGRYLDILITHAPPHKIGDRPDPCHTGFRCFVWFMKHVRPRYLLHGHIHLYDLNARRRHRYRQTEVINVYSHLVLEY